MAHQPYRQQGAHGRGGPNRSGPPGQGGGRPPTPPATIERPNAYHEGGSKRPALFDAEAQAEAKLWAASGIKTAQLRRFFGAAMAHLRRIDLGQSDDLDTEAAMALMKASATYAAARERKHEPIRQFFEHHYRLARTRDDFRLFARHFEAVVAYHRALESNHGGGRD